QAAKDGNLLCDLVARHFSEKNQRYRAPTTGLILQENGAPKCPSVRPSDWCAVLGCCFEVLLLSEVYANRWAEGGRSEGRADLTCGRPSDRPEAWGVNVRAPTAEARRPARPGAPLSATENNDELRGNEWGTHVSDRATPRRRRQGRCRETWAIDCD
ncbi:hypothetical protein BDFB_003821, partial [Asbolus verrucosus]